MEKNFKNLFGLIKEKSVPVIDPISEETRNGMHKAYIPRFLYKPPFGYPRYVDLLTIRRLAASPFTPGISFTSPNPTPSSSIAHLLLGILLSVRILFNSSFEILSLL